MDRGFHIKTAVSALKRLATANQEHIEDVQLAVADLLLPPSTSDNTTGQSLQQAIQLPLAHLSPEDQTTALESFSAWLVKKSTGDAPLFRGSTKSAPNAYLDNHVAGVKKSDRKVTEVNDPGTGSPALWMYDSKSGDKAIQLNGQVADRHGGEILCRHLAYAFISNDQVYHAPLANLQLTIPTTLDTNIFDTQHIMHRSNHLSAFRIENLGEALYTKCTGMQPGDHKHMLFASENHLMGITVHYKAPGYVVLKFYNPNNTTVHTRVVMRDVDALKLLKIEHFLSSEDVSATFPQLKGATLATYDFPNDIEHLPPQHAAFDFPPFIGDHTSTFATFAAYMPIFAYATRHRHAEVVPSFINAVINSAILDGVVKLTYPTKSNI